MPEIKPNTLPAKLVLKTGQTLSTHVSKTYSVTASSYTADTVHRFPSTSDSDYFVQGDNIAYVEVKNGH
jgi:hypothetical protein